MLIQHTNNVTNLSSITYTRYCKSGVAVVPTHREDPRDMIHGIAPTDPPWSDRRQPRQPTKENEKSSSNARITSLRQVALLVPPCEHSIISRLMAKLTKLTTTNAPDVHALRRKRLYRGR